MTKNPKKKCEKFYQIKKGKKPFAPLPENVDLFWRSLSVGHLWIISDFRLETENRIHVQGQKWFLVGVSSQDLKRMLENGKKNLITDISQWLQFWRFASIEPDLEQD